MKQKFVWSICAVMLLVILAACGSTNEDTANGSEEPANDEGTASQEIIIQHALGETPLAEIPERIVALEWTYVEDLLALGIQPVGVADIAGYQKWVNIEPDLSEKVVDVGTRQEPNLETIASLDPDLIITSDFRHEAVAAELEAIAPTVMFQPYPPEGGPSHFEEMEQTFLEIAKAVDRVDEAEQVLADINASFENYRNQVETMDIETTDYLIAQAFTSGEVPTLRLFEDHSMVVEVMDRIGLNNVFDSEQFQVYGYAQTTVEALQDYQEANFFYIVQEDDNVFENQLAGNPVWENLQFVQENRTYGLPGDTWTFGGPLSAEVLAKQVVDALGQ